MAVDFTKYPKIWCPNCVAIVPLVTDEMPPDRANKHSAVDLLCGECRYIVATLHEIEASK